MKGFSLFFICLFVSQTFVGQISKGGADIMPFRDSCEIWLDDVVTPFRQVSFDEFSFTDRINNITLSINALGQYCYFDSTLYQGLLFIRFNDTMVFDSLSVLGGCRIGGEVIKGYKEGEWTESCFVLEKKRYVLTKKMNYKNGQLHGDYFVFGAGSEVIPYQETPGNPVAPTSSFENGTGMYVDFYIFPPYQLKVRGMLVNGRREGRWNVYDKDGEVIVSYIFRRGICINL